VLSISQWFEDGAGAVNTLKRDGVTSPVQLNTLLLQGEEDDQGANSDGAGEGGRGDAERGFINMKFAIRRNGGRSLVVLGPPAQVAVPDVVAEGVGNGNGGPNIGQIVGSPGTRTNQEDWGMDVGENPVLLAEEVEGDGQNSSGKETPQKSTVGGTMTEHLVGTESTPKDRSGEERVVSGASEVVLLLRRTDIGDLGHLVVENRRTDKGGD
jgi:hypothetical protein